MIDRKKSLGPAWLYSIAGVTLLVGFLIAFLNLYRGELNQDEGWYLLGARAVAEGQRPYADFAFTQGPVFLSVYSRVTPWIERDGLRAGRIFTGLLGLLAIGLASGLAARLAPPRWGATTALLTFMLLWVNAYHNYFSLVVKTYSLTAVLFAAACLCLVLIRPRGAWVFPLLAGVLMALAAGVRLSAGILLPWIGIYWLWKREKYPHAWWLWGIGGAAGLAIAYGSVLLHASENAWFWLVEYHGARTRGSWFDMTVLKAGFVSRFVQAYFVLFAVLVVWITGASVAGRKPLRFQPPVGLLWGCVGVVTLVHIMAPFPYEDYQVYLMPVMAALVASGVVTWVSKMVLEARQEVWQRGLSILFLLLVVASAFSSPLNQNWFIRGRDRIWWPMKEAADLVILREVGEWLRDNSGGQGRLLTQDAYLAIESGLSVPPGFEMGPFSLYPDWDRETALRRNVVNLQLIKDWIEDPAVEWVALSDYGFAISSPDVVPIDEEVRRKLIEQVESNFELVKAIPYFGQAHTPLRIFRRAHNRESELQ